MKSHISLPVIVTRDIVVFPDQVKTLELGRESSLKSYRTSITKYEGKAIVVSQKDANVDEFTTTNAKNVIHPVGVIVAIVTKNVNDDGTVLIEVKATLDRVLIDDFFLIDNIFFANYKRMPLTMTPNKSEKTDARVKALYFRLSDELKRFLMDPQLLRFSFSPEIIILAKKFLQQKRVLTQSLLTKFAFSISQSLRYPHLEKQKLLEFKYLDTFIMELMKILKKQKTVKDLDSKINSRVKEEMNNMQREYMLRQKLSAIQKELGQISPKEEEIAKMREKIKTEPFPKHIKDRVSQELKRYESLQYGSSEANILKQYLDTLLSLPWYQKTTENTNIAHCKKILNRDHYGLKKIKERIIEYLSVQQRTHSLKGSILCFVGPPGTGKTSLARSIAEATGRVYIRMALGGVKDESEIRGHRKTYVGAMPGRIIQMMKKAKVINPLFLLDEIDKLSSDYRGDPASAMLEVLDPEQNRYFSDNFLEESYDLSNVLFVATANNLEGIPEPLYDRMEIIQLSSYTELEKLEITKKHLLPKVLKQHALTSKDLQISPATILYIIRHYSKEAGVRNIERILARIARKIVVKLLEKQSYDYKIKIDDLHGYLGPIIYDFTKVDKHRHYGVVTGLAYTYYGGDILPIEANYYPGKGDLILTGKLGEVMKESANIAVSYIRSNAKKFHVNQDFFKQNNIHIHVPEGAVPKDGPSAGVTLTTCLLSLFLKIIVPATIAMTGEITLQGKVLPIGGLKEKLISANRSKITKVFIPEENRRNLEDIPEDVRKNLSITFVSNYDTIYNALFR